MTTTTPEQAGTCPRCLKYGKPVGKQPGPRGSTVWVYECVTPGCRWEGTRWVVQVMRDGTVPIRQKGEKDFEPRKL